MQLISVIILVYNVEKYLRKCIESVANQTCKELEIILVNDGSTDGGLAICEEYQKKDSRIRIIDKKNGGVSDARNAGVKAATGEYVFFIDGDDFILSNTIEVMYEAVISHAADLAICNYRMVKEGADLADNICKEKIKWDILDRDAAIAGLISGKPFYSIAWNKLYKRTILEHVKYPVGKINEDEFGAHQIYVQCNKVVITHQPFYAYVQHSKSIMSSYSLKRHSKAEAFQERVSCLQKAGCSQKIVTTALFRYLCEECNFRYNIKKEDNTLQDKKIIKAYMAEAGKVYRRHFFELNLIQHLKLLTFYLFPSFYRSLRKREVQN